MAEATNQLRLAISAYARFNNDEVQEKAMKLLAALDGNLDELSYEHSDEVDECVDQLEEAMNEADEEEEELEEDETS